MRDQREISETCTFSPNIKMNQGEKATENSKQRKMTPQKSDKFFERNLEWQAKRDMNAYKLK